MSSLNSYSESCSFKYMYYVSTIVPVFEQYRHDMHHDRRHSIAADHVNMHMGQPCYTYM